MFIAMDGEQNHDELLITVERFGLIPAANIFVRMSGRDKSIGFSLKRNQLIFTVFKDSKVIHKANILSTSNIFCPVSCSNLTGCEITDPPAINENDDDFVIETEYKNHDEKLLKEHSESEVCGLLDRVTDGCTSVEFSFRIKLDVNPCSNGDKYQQEDSKCAINNSDQTDFEEILNSLYSPNLQKYISYVICCTSCSHPLSKSAVVFQKIFSLPLDWSEIAENWFCHKHDNCDNGPSRCPKTNELFVTPLHFNINCSSLQNVVIESSCNVAKCKNCLSVLGFKKRGSEGMVQCFKDKIKFVEENSSAKEREILDQSKDAVKFVVATIQKELRETSSCKLCLECKVSKTEGTCLLLWVLSSNLQQFCIKKNLSGATNLEEIFRTKEVIKVLYNTAPLCSALARSWQHDFSVDVLRVSDSMINAILEVLILSSKKVLRDHLVVNNLLVGFLPLVDE